MVINNVFILGFAVNINDLWCEPVSGISILTSFHPFFVEKDKKLAKNHILTRGQIISRSLLFVGLNIQQWVCKIYGIPTPNSLTILSGSEVVSLKYIFVGSAE